MNTNYLKKNIISAAPYSFVEFLHVLHGSKRPKQSPKASP